MKSFVLAIVVFCMCSYVSLAQDYPSKSVILKIIGDVNRKLVATGENEMSVDTDIPFRYIDAKFTILPGKECLVIAPVLIGNNSRDLVIHFSKANSTLPWTKDYLHLSENAPYSAESADTIDLNPNDGLKEISYRFGSMIRGYKKDSFKIISLRSGKEKVLYVNDDFIKPGEDEYASSLSVGDNVYETDSIALQDINNDGIKELIETKKVGLLLSKVASTSDGSTYWDMQIDQETYSTIYSYKNGVFLKSQPKLIASETGDYNDFIQVE